PPPPPPRERFGLTWPGKRDAQRLAQTPTTATLVPDRDNSINWDTTQNVFIEGDNLEVLKILQKHYYGKIKMIYIDPPYNTGKDFVYRDNFRDGVINYLEWTQQANEQGKVSSNTESTGRYHTNWLNMLYPRLKLAKQLLTRDGIMAISIDAHELHNLIAICNEIFGEQNVLATLTVVNNLKGRSDDKHFATANEYCIICSRNENESIINGLPPTAEYLNEFNKTDSISSYKEVGLRKTGKNSLRKDRPNMFYPIYYSPTQKLFSLNTHGPEWVEIYPIDSKGVEGRWRWSKETLQNNINTELVAKPSGNGWTIYVKMRSAIDGKLRTIRPKTLWEKPSYDSGSAKNSLQDLFDGEAPFETPKSQEFLMDLLRVGMSHDGVVLDFFAGSGTTSHAVMQLNTEDGGNRRCISVQLPEPTPEDSVARRAGYASIADISRERIRRAGAKIMEKEAEKLAGRTETLDIGFRAYKLSDTNFAKWRATATITENTLETLFKIARNSAEDTASPETLFVEALLKLGLSLTEHYELANVAGLSVFSIDNGLVVGYFNEHMKPSLEQLRKLVDATEARLIVLEDAFWGDDELKTNLVQLCKTRGIDVSIA
ncbi:site-specific DNA-methyltransferase, partial [Actinotignum sp. GS-2025b]|uniref:site-specific DNA-methyltransferase n=1 Tax=Actinotignum sp. GS-2025b TaxID=3427275 RepID=UPI003F471B00